MSYLALADADRVQEYVFGPSQLRYVRGASRLQTQAIERIESQFHSEVIFANGGLALAEFDTGPEAQRFCQASEEVFRTVTRSATISAAYVDQREDSFPTAWKRVRDAVERRKRQRNDLSVDGAHWLWSSCERCGLRPAQTLVPEAGNQVVSCCDACSSKWWKGEAGAHEVADFERLGQLGSPENYLALLYLDLDRMGEYLERNIANKEQCRTVSMAVDEALHGSVDCATMHVTRRGEELRVVKLLVGGDDAVVIMAADAAVPFLREFREEFVKPARWEGLEPPWFSAGIVYAHSHFPISEFMLVAKQCCREAKKLRGQHSASFRLITSSLAEEGDQADRHATACPYSLDVFLLFCDQILELKSKEAPRSKIHRLHEICQEDELPGTYEYLNLLLRLSPPVRSILRKRECVGPLLWQHLPGGRVTRGADLVELWEFVHDQ
ncbi:MAG: hypothetical protein HY235_28455 [Acidobacteria bacterium]|nr:hypothetical protein [Acidobacteriota bacterium]